MTLYVGDSGIGLFPLAFIGLLILVAILRWRKQSWSYLLFFFIFGMYVLFAINEILFPMHISGDFVESVREHSTAPDVNLIPFQFSKFGTTPPLRDILLTSSLNILLTLPFGYGINFLYPIRAKHIVWVALGLGLTLEGLQLLISLLLRYPYRVVDSTDIIMNALGVLIGYALFRIFAAVFVWMINRLSIPQRGIIGYMVEKCAAT